MEHLSLIEEAFSGNVQLATQVSNAMRMLAVALRSSEFRADVCLQEITPRRLSFTSRSRSTFAFCKVMRALKAVKPLRHLPRNGSFETALCRMGKYHCLTII